MTSPTLGTRTLVLGITVLMTWLWGIPLGAWAGEEGMEAQRRKAADISLGMMMGSARPKLDRELMHMLMPLLGKAVQALRHEESALEALVKMDADPFASALEALAREPSRSAAQRGQAWQWVAAVRLLQNGPAALAPLQEAAALLPGDPYLWRLQGVVHDYLRQPEEAERAYRQELAAAQALQDDPQTAQAYSKLGRHLQSRRAWGEAAAMHRASLALVAKLGIREAQAVQHRHLWMCAAEQGEWQTAHDHQARERALVAQGGDRLAMAVTTAQRGQLLSRQGERDQAVSVLNQALEEFDALGNREMQQKIYDHLVELHYARNDEKQALAALTQGLRMREATLSPRDMAETYEQFGLNFHRRQMWRLAEELLRKGLAQYEKLGDRQEMLRQYLHLARLQAAQQQWEAARQEAEQALEQARALGHRPSQQQAAKLLEQIRQKDPGSAQMPE